MDIILILAGVILGALLLLFALFILACRPGKPRERAAYFASFNYAHRGLHGGRIPENSLAAFRAATESGYGIELDVQLSKDGVPMVFHDGSLKRMCGGIGGGIKDYTAEELGKIKLADSEETIPTFEETLTLVNGCTPLIVEIKNDGDGIATAKSAADILDKYKGEYCVESFNPFIVRWFCKNRPEVIRGQLSEHFWIKKKRRKPMFFALQLMLLNFLSKPDFIAFNFKHRSYISFRIAKLWGAVTFAWTPRNEDEAAQCGEFDAMIFENIKADVRNEA